MLTGSYKVSRADIGRQHGFFNQPVSDVACAGHDLFNASRLIANNLGFGGFKVHRTAYAALF